MLFRSLDIRNINYAKSIATEGKLNLSTLSHQDCIDSCLRLKIEHLLAQKNYRALNKMGVRLRPGMKDKQIDRVLSRYFQTTNTAQFARRHHEIGHKMTDSQIERSNIKFEVGDFITFNEKGRLGGHTVLIMAKAKRGREYVYRIATSTLPATDMALYRGWVHKDELLGGTSATAAIGSLGGIGSILSGVLFEKGLKSEDHTVSVGRLKTYKNTRVARKKGKNKKEKKA